MSDIRYIVECEDARVRAEIIDRSIKTSPRPCPHGMPAGKSCAVRCVCSHRCDDHDHGPNNAECWGDSESAGPAVAGASLCECERFTAQSGEG